MSSYISNAIVSAEIAALHEQIASAYGTWECYAKFGIATEEEFTKVFLDLVGMLPSDLRPAEVPAAQLYPGVSKKKRRVEDML